MHGDQVLVEVTNIRDDGRAEGRILRPVHRAHMTVVGIFHNGSRNNYVVALDNKISQQIVIPHGMEYPQARDSAESAWGQPPRLSADQRSDSTLDTRTPLERQPRAGVAT